MGTRESKVETLKCEDCGMGYSTLKDDIEAHAEYHLNFRRAEDRHGEIRIYLEAPKMEAHRVIRSDPSNEVKAKAMEEVCRCHFERSVGGNWFTDWNSHPTFREYARAYSASNADKFWSDYPEALKIFKTKYPPISSPCLPPGASYWTASFESKPKVTRQKTSARR